MVSRIKRQRTFLKSLIKSKPRNRNQLIRGATIDQIKSIRESILNVANRNVPLKPTQLKKLKRYKKVLSKLAFANPSHTHSKKLIVQRGGFLGVLLPPVLSFLAANLTDG